MPFYAGKYLFEFFYYVYDSPLQVGHDAWATHETVCIMTHEDDEDDMGVEGNAFCSINDEYDVVTGEKIALERLLGKIDFTEEEVQEFWNGYYE